MIPPPCEHETERVKGCPYCTYLAEKYDGWSPWEDMTWD